MVASKGKVAEHRDVLLQLEGHLTGFDRERVVNIAAEVGNQVAASLPFTLDVARERGLVTKGDRIVMLGTSAGVSFGGLVLDV